jgi:hypothetical protein
MLTGRLMQIPRLSWLTFHDNIPGNLWSVFLPLGVTRITIRNSKDRSYLMMMFFSIA